MDRICGALAAQHDELDALISGLTEDEWNRPSRCPGWTVCDVVLHLAQTDELTVSSGEGRFAEAMTSLAGRSASTIDEAAAAAVARERGAPGSAVYGRWRAAAEAVRAFFGGCDPKDRFSWVTGQLAARTFATTRLAETWIHTGDIAVPLDIDLPATDRLWHVARLAWRTLPYAFAQAGYAARGPVGVRLTTGDGSAWEFGLDSDPLTTVRGSALEFCLVAGRRLDPHASTLAAEGPDGQAVLDLVRTYA
ncbi:MAG: maleylpyruvate isomerase family mycothiol-dependent enzyme [Egibacteraceae bacterium]